MAKVLPNPTADTRTLALCRGVSAKGRTCALALLSTLSTLGCQGLYTPHETYTFAGDFSAQQRDAIRTAIALWGVETGWRPEEVSSGGELEIVGLDAAGWRRSGKASCSEVDVCVGANFDRSDAMIRFNLEYLAEFPSETFALVAAHELGHICIDGHIDQEGSIMYELASEGSTARAAGLGTRAHIDYLSVMAWEDGCL